VATGETESTLASRLAAHGVSVAIDAGVAGTLAAGRVLVSTLARLPGGLSLDPDGLDRREIEALLEAVAKVHPDRVIEVRTARLNDLRVDIGPQMRGGLHGVPIGHGYRIGWSTPPLSGRSRVGVSGLGSVSTAAALAGEIFKEAAGVSGIRGRRPRSRSFCPVSLSARPEDGPDLPPDWRLDGAVAGVGAIGTGIALVLSLLPIAGVLLLIDRQVIAIANLGTYSLGGIADVEERRPKTVVAARVLRNFSTRCFDGDVADLPARIDGGLEIWPRVILAGLDSPDARRDLQQIWPDLLIDGATGDTMAGMHEVIGAGQPCMECLFPPGARSTAVEALATATGLSLDIAGQGSMVLSEEHLEGLAAERQSRLRPLVGSQICGLASALGLTDLDEDDYQPAVPFVSLTAATLVVGRLIARSVGRQPRTNVAQFDVLAGPHLMSRMHRRGVAGCRCDLRRSTISRVRALRDGAATPESARATVSS
jgi:hypothetical protein